LSICNRCLVNRVLVVVIIPQQPLPTHHPNFAILFCICCALTLFYWPNAFKSWSRHT
jgi:hypothetical protein